LERNRRVAKTTKRTLALTVFVDSLPPADPIWKMKSAMRTRLPIITRIRVQQINELAQITAPPPSNRGIEKIIHINKLESKRIKTADYVGIIKREGKILKKEKTLAKALQELGAMTGCYGYLYLSKYASWLALLIFIDRKPIMGRSPSRVTSFGPLRSTRTRSWKICVWRVHLNSIINKKRSKEPR
jgi:hypothetical protein